MTDKQAQEETRKKIAKTFYQDIQDHMEMLYSRWADEKEYEDIRDYGVSIEHAVKKIGGTFLKMSKRPFGFTYELMGATYQVQMKSTQYLYKRIK